MIELRMVFRPPSSTTSGHFSPGHQHAYLVCKVRGVLEETKARYSPPTVCGDCEFAPWSQVQPEVWFTGICPQCA